jgi:predicted secreted protein
MSATASKVSKMLLTVGSVPTELGEVRSFSIETSLGTIDVSTLATDWKKYLVGQAGWSGSLECFYDPMDAAQADLVSKARAGTLCTVTVQPLGAGAGKTQLSGTCYVTSMSISGATEDAVGLSISFQGTGELALAADAS